MRVDRLVADRRFRQLRELEVDFPAGPQVVVGHNAAGKTNLLEAMVVLGTARSHRASTDAELIALGRRLRAARGGPGRDAVRPSGQPARGRASPGRRRAARASGCGSTASPAARRRWPRHCRSCSSRPRTCCSSSARPRCAGATRSTRSWSRPCPPRRATMSTYARALTQRNNLLRAHPRGAGRAATSCATGTAWSSTRAAASSTGATRPSPRSPDPLADAHREIAPDEDRLALRYVTNAPPLEGETTTRRAAPAAG